MAIYHASTKSLSRSDGRSAVASVAYRAGVRLTDERTGLVHDYSRRHGVVSAEILLPGGDEAERSELWNAVEAAERRKDSRTGREWVLALPSELDAEQRHELARGFALELVRRYGVAVDMAIHEPSREGDERNHHAHLFATTRSVSRAENGALVLGEKVAPELSDTKRRKLGLNAASEEVAELRGFWEHLANEALERAGREERITAKSFEAQGVDREPTTHLGPSATAMERRGEASERGEINRQAEARNAEREAVAAEIIDLKAEKDRRAKEAQERKDREAREREEEAQRERIRKEREVWEGMTARQLAREIERERPPDLAGLVDQRPEVRPVREATEALAAQRLSAEQRHARAFKAARAWRNDHPFLSRLHDLGFFPAFALRRQERSMAQARKELEELRPQLSRSEAALFTAQSLARVEVLRDTRAARERVEGMEAVRERKEREEAAEARREAQERQEREARRQEAQAREEALRAAREAAEREAARREQKRTEERRRVAVEKGGEAFREEVRRDPEAMRVHMLKTYMPQEMTPRQRETWGERMREIGEIEQAPEASKEASRAPSAKAKEPEPWRDLSPSSPPKPKSRDRGGWDRDR